MFRWSSWRCPVESSFGGNNAGRNGAKQPGNKSGNKYMLFVCVFSCVPVTCRAPRLLPLEGWSMPLGLRLQLLPFLHAGRWAKWQALGAFPSLGFWLGGLLRFADKMRK